LHQDGNYMAHISDFRCELFEIAQAVMNLQWSRRTPAIAMEE